MTRVLVVGRGGREAALAWRLAQSREAIVYCAPGNAGIAQYATCVPIDETKIDALLSFARDERIDLTVVGPEAPLYQGIADRFSAEGKLILAPTAEAARAEKSKAWFKRFLARHQIPTAEFEIFTDPVEALGLIRSMGPENIVIKADGPMAGKGVVLPNEISEAENTLKRFMVKDIPDGSVVIERRLSGVERSVMAVTDGKTLHVLPFTQDYKRVGDGDEGPNTGGMGTHTLSLPESEQADLHNILDRVLAGFAHERIKYTAFIYLGVMMTEEGPKVLECNCRLGDPEAQVILPSIGGDFLDLCMQAAAGRLSRVDKPRQVSHALNVVLASGQYPGSSDRDDEISDLNEAEKKGARLFHAGTGWRNSRFTTNCAGRILGVTGVADTLAEAHTIAYAGVGKISFPGMKYRTDIGAGVI